MWSLWLRPPQSKVELSYSGLPTHRSSPFPWPLTRHQLPSSQEVFEWCTREKDKSLDKDQDAVILELEIARPSPTFLGAGTKLHRPSASKGSERSALLSSPILGHLQYFPSVSRRPPWPYPRRSRERQQPSPHMYPIPRLIHSSNRNSTPPTTSMLRFPRYR